MAVEAYVDGSPVIVANVLGSDPAAAQNSGATYIKGDPGPPGPQGPEGPAGPAGQDGRDGIDGQDGSDGQDGFSPTVTPSAITGGHRLTIVDVGGTSTVDVMDGVDGQDGADGQDGQNGQDGTPAGFGTPTATVDSGTGTPGVTVTASGPDTAKVFDFAFTNLKGATGDAGPTGSDGERGGITHRITGTIQGYSTPVGNYVPAGRIAIATVISQSGASDVIVGDLLLKADYVYGVGAVDATYAYVSAGTSIKGDKGDTGNTGSTGPAGPRGASILHVTTAPTGTPNDTYLYKIAISTVVSQSGVSPIVGDIIEYSYYHYPVAALDSTYAYLSTRISIRGAKGATGEGVPASGTTGQVLVKKSNTDYDTEWVDQSAGVDPATATPLMDGTAAVGTSVKYAREDHVHPTDTGRAAASAVLQSSAKAITVDGTWTYSLTGLTADHVVGNWGMFTDNGLTGPIPENAPPCDIIITTASGSWTITVSGVTSNFYIMPTFLLKQN